MHYKGCFIKCAKVELGETFCGVKCIGMLLSFLHGVFTPINCFLFYFSKYFS